MSQSLIIYRIIFSYEGKTQELFAKYISEESLIGFVEVEELLFSTGTSIINTQEELLRDTFEGVKRTYLPLSSICRIDELSSEQCQRLGLLKVEKKQTVAYLSAASEKVNEYGLHRGEDV